MKKGVREVSRNELCNSRYLVLFSWLLVFFLMVTAAGCGGKVSGKSASEQGSEDFPVTIIDDMGRKVTLASEPQRLISLAPSHTEILFALDLGDRVVGVTTFCDYPEEAKSRAKIGGFSSPSLEKIVALEPDLILATSMHQQIIGSLEDAGLAVLVFCPRKVADIMHTIEVVGQATGRQQKANLLIEDMEERVNEIKSKVSAVPEAERPSVYYELWYEPLMTVSSNNLIGELIELAGGRNIAADTGKEYPQLSEEVIIANNPDIMLHSYGHGDEKVPDAEEIAARKGWENLSFVKNKRIYQINADIVSRSGPRIVQALEEMAAIFHPDLICPQETAAGGDR